MASIDFQLREDGTAVASITPHDSKGNDVAALPAGSSVPAWTSSSTAVSLAPAADGLSAVITPGAVLATGVAIHVSCTLPNGTVITEDPDTELLDVVGGMATGFRLKIADAGPTTTPPVPGPSTTQVP